MLLKQLLNNLPICLVGGLNCICTHVSIKVNVFIQKNAYQIHNYVHKSFRGCIRQIYTQEITLVNSHVIIIYV